MISPAPAPSRLWRRIVVAGRVAELPRLAAVAVTDAGRGYRHEPWRRAAGQLTIQVTLAGTGGIWRADDAVPQPLGLGSALLFRSGHDRLAYAPLVPGLTWRFVYADIAGSAALAMADGLIARLGNVVAATPQHPAVKAIIALDADDGRGRPDLRMPAVRAARLANDLLLMLAEALPDDDPSDERLAAAALRELERVIDDPAAIATAARALRISREHMGRTVKRIYGETPSEWLRRRRINLATSLLGDPSRSIATIAGACGFATASHFVHAFSLMVGVTPGAYRKQLQSPRGRTPG
jgi:AraC-like DNA-binding protein